MTSPLLHSFPVQQSYDEDELRAAVQTANIPTLLMVVFQLTGERSWLREPYLAERIRGVMDNDSGGLDETAQADVREAAVRALLAWGLGAAPAIPAPDAGTVVEMLSASVGEAVSPEVGAMSVEILAAATGTAPLRSRIESFGFTAVIIGAGISGLAAAIELRAAGIDYIHVDKNAEVGGTWWENRYPGAGVDTPSYVYSFSSFPRKWSTFYGRRNEVSAYLREVATVSGVRDGIRFETEVVSAIFDDEQALWTVTLRDRSGVTEAVVVNAVISAVGLLNRPSVPQLQGSELFTGRQCHSAVWPEDLDVTGKRVAVIGSGASAMQVVPAIVDRVAHLTVLQRSPQWIAPSTNYFAKVPASVHWLMDRVPFYYSWYRLRLSWMTNDRLYPALLVDPEWSEPARSINVVNDAHRRSLTRYIESELAGRDDLLAKSLPTYPPYGKRMLIDNGWYSALRRPEVDLVTDAVVALDETGFVTSAGDHVDADIIVWATGFEAQKMLHPLDIRGRSGISIRDAWGADNPRAYLGVTVPDFPNLFIMYGPNLNLGHGGSYMYFGELQARYIADLITETVQHGSRAVEVRRDVHDEYNKRVDDAHAGMIWSHGGMETWYRNAAGRVVTNSPWRVVDYWRMTAHVDTDDFVFDNVGGR